MNQELKRARLLHGRALIRSYYDDWLPEKKRIDRFLEDVVSSLPYLKEDPIQGGGKTPPQERLLQLKEENKAYCELEKNIEKMEKILDGLTDSQKDLVFLRFVQGCEPYEIAKALNIADSTFYKWLNEISIMVYSKWEEPFLSIPGRV